MELLQLYFSLFLLRIFYGNQLYLYEDRNYHNRCFDAIGKGISE